MLEGRKITLRLFAEADLDEFLTLYGKLIERGEFFPISLKSAAETRKEFGEHGWWEEHTGRMLITTKDGRMLGGIGFYQPSPYQSGYELGYGIFRPEDRGKGIMTAALRIFSAYLFELKPTPRLQVTTAVGNRASRRIAEKCGYQFEGTLRQFFYMRGKYHDCDLLSLLRGECPSLSEALQS
jgi:ribosomal-protein-alanine N-acetyltransferase